MPRKPQRPICPTCHQDIDPFDAACTYCGTEFDETVETELRKPIDTCAFMRQAAGRRLRWLQENYPPPELDA